MDALLLATDSRTWPGRVGVEGKLRLICLHKLHALQADAAQPSGAWCSWQISLCAAISRVDRVQNTGKFVDSSLSWVPRPIVITVLIPSMSCTVLPVALKREASNVAHGVIPFPPLWGASWCTAAELPARTSGSGNQEWHQLYDIVDKLQDQKQHAVLPARVCRRCLEEAGRRKQLTTLLVVHGMEQKSKSCTTHMLVAKRSRASCCRRCQGGSAGSAVLFW